MGQSQPTAFFVDQTVEYLAVRPPPKIVSTERDQCGPFDWKSAHLAQLVDQDLAKTGQAGLPEVARASGDIGNRQTPLCQP
jgi:hypothetical protein